MKVINCFYLCFILFLACSFASCSNQDNRKAIIGRWRFDSYYTDGALTPQMTEDLKVFNQVTKGLIITFKEGGMMKSEQKGGSEINNSDGVYNILKNGQLALGIDTATILQLDENFLKLSSEGKPNILFRRID
ncbi:hypothetical protein [Flavihumibacter profundi]|uniref:hypothetical protein n=1 Tax=Flavihumibacter profundi TaxID=2716883 RepID=UPI001CC427E2|nr:hypothetical protein [Flavihumibacter profundi]MBZ5857312.1 hypothetical protein [Flavihumibacter profundi]